MPVPNPTVTKAAVANPTVAKRIIASAWILILLIVLPSSLFASEPGSPESPASPGSSVPSSWQAVSPSGPWLVRVPVNGQATIDRLSADFDVWRVLQAGLELEILVNEAEYRALTAQGLTLQIDAEQTRSLARLGIPLPGQGGGIPGFPCYRTVEETYASAESIVANHPDLASWIDIGDSWEKIQNSANGYDLFVLKLTQSSVPGPKPVLFSSFAIHSREYTTAELGTRFAEFLAGQYDIDPDVTWLLDHHEVHLLLQANPDGRKRAETGAFWRKNTNNDYCSNTDDRGTDLNRNFEYEWNCCGGSSGNQCSTVYRGPSPASEPEIQALQNYVRSIFPDQRGPNLDDPAPDDAAGVALDVHSSGQLILWPWGFESAPTPNGTAMTTLGRKLAYFNDYFPLQIRDFTLADGSSVDFYYGDLGVAGFGYELGTQFFESCSNFETNVVPGNLDSLFYAAKVARTPYLTPAGPEAHSASAQPPTVDPGTLVQLSAVLDDTRFQNSNGTEPSQTIASAEAFVGVPPWSPGAVPISMNASDGTFDQNTEVVEVQLDTSGLSAGRHLLYVRGTDSAGNTGVVSAAFLEITGSLFEDGFESGDLVNWSSSQP